MTSGKARREKGGGLFINTVSALIICAALVLGTTVFFRVSNIEVRGASRYSEEEIIAAAGVKEGSNLVFLNRAAVEARILEELIYAGRVQVSRRLPNTIVIELHESGSVACVETESGPWLIDNYGRLLEAVPAGNTGNYVNITGFYAMEPKAGAEISVPEEDKSKVEYLEQLLSAMQNANMLGDVSSIDLSTSSNAQFEYLGRFRVKLGRSDKLESKLALLQSAISELEDTETGVFDMSEPQKAHFSPE